jgi:prepilin-type N-terminal cleavage/methylation domain-containing protein
MNKTSPGFTLVETLIAVFIFSLMATAMAAIIVHLYQSYAFSWQQTQAIDEAQRGAKTMLREIREARTGADGSYPIEKAGDSEFIFYSDIDGDGLVERVRYFLGGTSRQQEIKTCVSFTRGGSCSVVFSDFYQGILEEAQARVGIEGDFGWSIEYAEIFADGAKIDNFCDGWGECNDCAGTWQGTKTFDIFQQAQDNYIQFIADTSWWADPICYWEEPGHSMKARFELFWTETVTGQERQLKKGVIKPTGFPPVYPSDQEEIVILSHYVQNKIDDPETKLFVYFDKNGEEILEYPARPEQTRLLGVSLIINVDPARAPRDYRLESKVKLRNLILDDY